MNKTEIIGKHSSNWETSGLVVCISGGPQPDGFFYAVPRGVHPVKLGIEASISQYVKVIPGSVYSLTFGATRTCARDRASGSLSLCLDTLLTSLFKHSSSAAMDGTPMLGLSPLSNLVKLAFHNPGLQENSLWTPFGRNCYQGNPASQVYKSNLVKTGGFEYGPHVFKNFSIGILLPLKELDEISPLPGWIVESLKPVRYNDKRHFFAPSSFSAVELVGGRESAIAQIIRTIPNTLYNLVFKVGDSKDGCHGSLAVQAYAGTQTFQVPYISTGKGGFKIASPKF